MADTIHNVELRARMVLSATQGGVLAMLMERKRQPHCRGQKAEQRKCSDGRSQHIETS